MSGIQSVSLRVPAEWDAGWFRHFITDVLSKADVRNATGSGVVVSSTGNSVATLTATPGVTTAVMNAAIADAVDDHEIDPDPHPIMQASLRSALQSYAYFVD